MILFQVVVPAVTQVEVALPALRRTLKPVRADAVPITVQLLVTRIIFMVYLKKSQVFGVQNEFYGLFRD